MKTLEIKIMDDIQVIVMDYKGNSFTVELLSDLVDALEQSKNNEKLRAVIITGKKIFSGGGDVFGMKENLDKGADMAEYIHSVISKAAEVILAVIDHPLPVISAINRAAAGAGLSLAMACDHRIAEENTRLVTAFGTLALIPDSGASVLLPIRFGSSITMRSSATGDNIPLELALNTGGIDSVVSSDKLMEEAITYANSYKAADRITIARTKQLVNRNLRKLLVAQFSEEETAMNEMAKREAFHHRVTALVERLSKK